MNTPVALSTAIKRLGAATAAAFFLMLSGCATGPNANPRDPFEPYNRKVTAFNDAVDNAVLKPVAEGYIAIVPSLVRTGIKNFFGNVGDAWSAVNNALQGKGAATGDMLGRLLINTTFGLGGIFDVAGEAGIPKHSEDFGQTLGVWGVPSGPYFVIPVLGPSTVRDAAAKVVDLTASPLGYLNDLPLRYSLNALQVIDTRTQLLGVTSMVDQAALDRYSFMRDAYLQYRQNQVDDGKSKGDADSKEPAEERYDLPETPKANDKSAK